MQKFSRASSGETNQVVFDMVVGRLKDRPLKIVDMGCGSGFLLNELKNYYV